MGRGRSHPWGMAATAAFGDLARDLRVCTGSDPGLGGKPCPKAAEAPGLWPGREAQPGSPHPPGAVLPSLEYGWDVPPGRTRRRVRPKGHVPPLAPALTEGFCAPSSPVLSSPPPHPQPASAPPKYQTARSINSRVACQVHSLTSQITHAKPQVFYETFPVMKTFLWGFIFFFPSSSPLLLLLLLPAGRWPAWGAAAMPPLIAKRWSRASAESCGVQRGRRCRSVPSPLPPRQPLGRVWSPPAPSWGLHAGAAVGARPPNRCVSLSLCPDLSTASRAQIPVRDAEHLPRPAGEGGGLRAPASCRSSRAPTAPRGTRASSVSQSSPAPGTHKLWWEAEGVHPGSVGQTPPRRNSVF